MSTDRTSGVAQMVERLPSKCKFLSSNHITTEKNFKIQSNNKKNPNKAITDG
jgi:hypothetical protein